MDCHLFQRTRCQCEEDKCWYYQEARGAAVAVFVQDQHAPSRLLHPLAAEVADADRGGRTSQARLRRPEAAAVSGPVAN